MCHNENEPKIKKLEDKIRKLQFENIKLTQMYNIVSDKSEDILNVKVSEAINARSKFL